TLKLPEPRLQRRKRLWGDSFSLPREMNAGAGANLLVAEAIGGPVELHDIHALGRGRTRRASTDHDAVAGLQSKFRHTDVDQFGKIIEFEFPAFVLGINYDERMRVHKVELGNDTIDRYLTGVVVDARYGVVQQKRQNYGKHRRLHVWNSTAIGIEWPVTSV